MTPQGDRKAIEQGHSRRAALGLGSALALAPLQAAAATSGFPTEAWLRADPSSHGWNAQGLAVAKAFSEKIQSSALIIVQHGKIIDSWGPIDRPFTQHSVRKSFVSALYGIYTHNGKIDLFESLADLDIDDNPPLTAEEKQSLVVYLLESRSGVYHAAAYETEEQQNQRPARGSHNPGTWWWYNNWDFNVAGAIFERKTGLSVYEAFDRSIARPLGMQDFRLSDQNYYRDAASIYPAYPFLMSARDAARFGLLYLRKGRWNRRQIIPADWVTKSTSPISDWGDGRGYGYLWWAAPGERQFGVNFGLGCFSAQGSGGNMIVVAPAHDLVIVHEGDKEGGKFVSDGDFGGLLRRIMDAAPAPPGT